MFVVAIRIVVKWVADCISVASILADTPSFAIAVEMGRNRSSQRRTLWNGLNSRKQTQVGSNGALTASAALKLGRHFLGFEISEAYCKIARDRIALVQNQPNLFDRTIKLAEQARLYEGPDKSGALHGELDALVELQMLKEKR